MSQPIDKKDTIIRENASEEKENRTKLLIKFKSKKFRNDFNEVTKTKTVKVIFQRSFRCALCTMCKNTVIKKSSEDTEDVIIINRQAVIINGSISDTKEQIRDFLGEDIESGCILQIDDLEDVEVISDKEFKQVCIHSSLICHRYVKIFTFLEMVGYAFNYFAALALPLAEYLNIPPTTLIIIFAIILPVIVLQSVSDWGKLTEKYARLCQEFSKLSNCKTDSRLESYSELSNSFKNSWIYSDTLSEKNN